MASCNAIIKVGGRNVICDLELHHDGQHAGQLGVERHTWADDGW